MKKTDSKKVWKAPSWLEEGPPPVAVTPGPAPQPPPGAPRPLPWRSALAGWSTRGRERWGRLTASLEAAGLGWREAEREAFEQMGGTVPPMDGESPDPEGSPHA